MRSIRRATIISSLCLIGAIAAGCEQKQATEYVTGISTQVRVPRDLKAIRLTVSVGGVVAHCGVYRVYDGKVQLPRSLGTFPSIDSAVNNAVTYSILGIQEEPTDNTQNPLFLDCLQPFKIGENNARILRRSRQLYVKDEILFLPMPLKYSCYDVGCENEDETCKGGKCVSATLTEEQTKNLPKYGPELLDGTGSTCFSMDVCFATANGLTNAGAPSAIPIDDNCTFAIPGTAGFTEFAKPIPNVTSPYPANVADGNKGGLNVEISWDGGLSREVLDVDGDEGFIVDPAKFVGTKPEYTGKQLFQLAPTLCEMFKGLNSQGQATNFKHRITGVRASAECQPKAISQPLCQKDQLKQMGLDNVGLEDKALAPSCETLELKSPPSALVVVVDDTQGHKVFFDRLNKAPTSLDDEDQAVEPAVKAALQDPALRQTKFGLVYPKDACTVGAPDIAPTNITVQNNPVLENLKAKGASLRAGTPNLEGALDRAYQTLNAAEFDSYYRRAVLVMGNRDFNNATQCGDDTVSPVSLATAAFTGPKQIKTYVMHLTKEPAPTGESTDLAVAGGTTAASYKAAGSAQKFAEIVNDLATCVYDVPTALAPKETDVVSFTNPLTYPTSPPVTMTYNAACNKEDVDGEGWGMADSPNGGKRIFLCKGDASQPVPVKACAGYREALKKTSAFVSLHQQPPLPVPLFLYRKDCQAQP